jgi:hypothetical protein
VHACEPVQRTPALRRGLAFSLDVAPRYALAAEAEARAWHVHRRLGTPWAFHQTPGWQGAREDLWISGPLNTLT